MKLDLNKKKVLVLGASKGIGFSISKHFLHENATVCLVSRKNKNLDKAVNKLKKNFSSKKIHKFSCDCSKIEELELLKNFVKKIYKKIDILICNVGDGKGSSKPIGNLKEWEYSWNNNFNAPFLSTLKLIPLFSNNSSLIFISSIAGKEYIGAPTSYSVAKSSLISFTKNLSYKLAPKTRVNTICPGNIYFSGGSWAKKLKDNPLQIKQMLKSKVPLNKFGNPDDIANCVLFLSSSKSDFITGSSVVIDGGQTISI